MTPEGHTIAKENYQWLPKYSAYAINLLVPSIPLSLGDRCAQMVAQATLHMYSQPYELHTMIKSNLETEAREAKSVSQTSLEG